MRFLVISNHPDTSCHPSNGGELGTYYCRINFPSAEGWRRIGPRENAIFVGDKSTGGAITPHPPSRKARHPRQRRWAFGCGDLWSLIEILHFCPGADNICVDCITGFYFMVAGQAVYHNINRNFRGVGTDFFFEI